MSDRFQITGGRSDPRGYLRILWRWKLLFLLFLVGVPLATYFAVSRETKQYQSTTLVEENALPVDTSLFTSGNAPSPSGGSPGSETLDGLARIIQTPRVAALAAGFLNPRPAHRSSLLGAIAASADPNTGFITITATDANAARAASIANAFGHAVVKLRSAQATGLLTTAINQLDVQLGQMKPGNVARAQLSSQVQRLRAMRATQGSDAQILQAATPASAPVSPKTTKVVGLSAVVGLLIAIGVVFLAEAADRRIRHPEDLEELAGRPLLAVVPRSAFSDKGVTGTAKEAFQMLRSALMFFNVDEPLKTILVTSPVKGDGKTTVATHLAVAAAQAGQKVILVDADMRRPQAAPRLGVSVEAVAPGHGLAGVLTGQSSLAEAFVEVQLPDYPGDAPAPPELRGSLLLLPAGGTPPNPSELLASQRMPALLHELTEMSDLVIIDSNPLLSVSDSLPLFDYVTGTIVVARLHSTTKDAIRRLQKTIANTSANVFGVVATGAAGGFFGKYGYGYGYGYYGYTSSAYANGDGQTGRGGRLRRKQKREQLTK